MCSFGKRMIAAGAIAIVTFAMSPLFAGEDAEPASRSFYVRAGAAGFFYNPSATVQSGGAMVPGAGASIDDNFTAAVELGVFPFSGHGLLDDLAVSLTLGIPPTASVAGAGSIAGAGTLGKATYGPVALTAHYHFRGLPIVQPYAGAGIAYAIVFGTEDQSMSHLSVDPAFGVVFQAGLEVPIGDRFAIFVDAKYVLLSTHVSGSFGGMPTSAELTLNPIVTTLGGTVRF